MRKPAAMGFPVCEQRMVACLVRLFSPTPTCPPHIFVDKSDTKAEGTQWTVRMRFLRFLAVFGASVPCHPCRFRCSPRSLPPRRALAPFLPALPARSHFHEHAVVSGSSTLRYSSTHRVAVTDGNTFAFVQKRCEDVLAGGDALAAEPGRILDLAQVCFSVLLGLP